MARSLIPRDEVRRPTRSPAIARASPTMSRRRWWAMPTLTLDALRPCWRRRRLKNGATDISRDHVRRHLAGTEWHGSSDTPWRRFGRRRRGAFAAVRERSLSPSRSAGATLGGNDRCAASGKTHLMATEASSTYFMDREHRGRTRPQHRRFRPSCGSPRGAGPSPGTPRALFRSRVRGQEPLQALSMKKRHQCSYHQLLNAIPAQST